VSLLGYLKILPPFAVWLVELTGIARLIWRSPIGRYAEVYLFIGLIYWVFCYWNVCSQRLERKLNIGQH